MSGVDHGPDRRPVAVLGATGLVGRAAVAMLRRDAPELPLRVGARRGPALHEIAGHVGAEPVPADADDPAALAAFCAGSRLVLNCAGPSYLLLDRVARVALDSGADYVDVSGDGPAHHLLAGTDPQGHAVVLSAGVLPGLANLVPAFLAGRRPDGNPPAGAPDDGTPDDGTVTMPTAAVAPGALAGARLIVHAGGIERFSPAAAGDLVLSVDGADGSTGDENRYGEPLAAWRGGRRVSRALAVAEDVEIPYFPGRVTTMPYLTADCERLARASGLTELEWHNVFVGSQLRLALNRLRGRVPRDPERLAAEVGTVLAAGEVDRAGREPYYLMAFTLSGAGGSPRTALLRTPSSFHLTAATAVLAARAVLAGRVPPGLHFADEVLDPAATLRGARRLGALPVLEVHEHDGDPRVVVEEGAL